MPYGTICYTIALPKFSIWYVIRLTLCSFQSCLDQATVDNIRAQIRQLIDSKPVANERDPNDLTLLGGFIRLAFHDCVGNHCDGCINNDHPDNAGKCSGCNLYLYYPLL